MSTSTPASSPLTWQVMWSPFFMTSTSVFFRAKRGAATRRVELKIRVRMFMVAALVILFSTRRRGETSKSFRST
jgi:hypothetical protein